MSVSWTEEQQLVISGRDKNILVSAAAGSGKTAVLVERILSMVTDEHHPVDIDSLLVVTFTRAAAAEMKERIRRALEDALAKKPENEHLQKQGALLHHAQITTIHGFCTYVIQNYFQMIDLDPVYRIADEGELKMMKKESLDEVLEESYGENGEDYLKFVECFSPGKSDDQIGDLILKLYEFSMSYPYPSEWLLECRKSYDVENIEELENAFWMQELKEEIREDLKNALAVAQQNIRTASEPDGPHMYLPMLESDEELVLNLLQIDAYDTLAEAVRGITYQPLSRKKDASVSEDLKTIVKNQRDDLKGILSEIAEKKCPKTMNQILRELQNCRMGVHIMTDLVMNFKEAYALRKRKKNVLDFADLEHFALQILVQKDGEDCVRTDAAKELAGRYYEVMIDEYQDSNYIQEYLLEAVSKVSDGQNNRFMVGDVKQSIYGFRMARPELFLEKQMSYPMNGVREQRIDLHKNFRSRSNVLKTVNYLFAQLMERELGGIEYDESEALNDGADYPKGQAEEFPDTEVLLIDSKSPEFEDLKSRQQMIETEALAVAQSIRSIVGKERVWDKDLSEYRTAAYRDCVVLLRTVSEWADLFSKVLAGQGIPAYSTSRTGYFSAVEVVTVLNYLHICDNPMQDIPFAAVLHSFIGNCTVEELARIRSAYPGKKIYEACACYACGEVQDELQQKLAKFLKQLEVFRERVPYTPIHELITQVLLETGYRHYAASMPGGNQREANLNMLVEKAVDYEGTSYRGLFNFIRYMEQIQKYQVDFGEVNICGEAADTVRIMSIHKSKGLEFPVVYVAGMGKRFNLMDTNAAVVFHSRLGIGVDETNAVLRIKTPTLLKQVIRQKLQEETLGEELRVLYVALTRAKEKLILTGTGDLEKWVKNCGGLIYDERMHLYNRKITGARSYFDWVLPALAGHPAFSSVLEMYQSTAGTLPQLPYLEADFRVRVLSPASLMSSEILEQMEYVIQREELTKWDTSVVYDGQAREEISRRFCYNYPYEDRFQIPVKMTVSELKRAGNEEPGEELYLEPDVVPLIPEFIKEQEEPLQGAARGTVYHRVFECLDYRSLFEHKADTAGELTSQTERMKSEGKLTAEDLKCLEMDDILQFLSGNLGRRMCTAGAEGLLRREQPFVMEIPASDVREDWGDEETILVQGIVDAFFQEGQSLVIVDYKTDKVPDGTGQCLVEKYQKQLLYYKKALERLTGMEVKEMFIYSVTIGKEIRI